MRPSFENLAARSRPGIRPPSAAAQPDRRGRAATSTNLPSCVHDFFPSPLPALLASACSRPGLWHAIAVAGRDDDSPRRASPDFAFPAAGDPTRRPSGFARRAMMHGARCNGDSELGIDKTFSVHRLTVQTFFRTQQTDHNLLIGRPYTINST